MLQSTTRRAALGLCAAVALAGYTMAPAMAETRITIKAAKPGSSYYVMSVQLAEALKNGTGGSIQPTVEDSQGSVQNVKEAARRQGAYVFTSPPSLIKRAMAGEKPFEKNDAYGEIRGLFPIPYLTMHWVVRADADVKDLTDLEGKDFIPGGKGSFGYRQTESVLKALGLEGKVNLVDVELDAAAPAVRNGQVVGMATAGSHPAPNVQELAATTKIRLLGLTDAHLEKVKGATTVIPAGTYSGHDEDTRTLTLPVGAYTTTGMDDETAYMVTKTYWEEKKRMGDENAWWGAVTAEMTESLGAKLHPGALRYYKEAGMPVAAHLE